MPRGQAIAAIDVGTTKVCALVGQLGRDGDLQVAGVGIAPARGMKKGMVVDIDEAAESIRVAVQRAERSSGSRIYSAYVGITGSHIHSVSNRAVVTVARPDRLVTGDDIDRVLEAARSIAVPANREVLHVLPRSYLLDGQDGLHNPVGLHGFRLDVETLIVTGAAASIQNLAKCVQGMGVEVEDLVLEPLASCEAVLTDDEREMGVIVADIGGGTTDLAVCIQGSIGYTSVIPLGGNHFTQDLAIGLRTPFEAAEEAKIRFGHADPRQVDPTEAVEIASFGYQERQQVLRYDVSSILRARVEELAEFIQAEVQRSGYGGLLPAGIVLTGGSANLRGLAPALAELLDMPARTGFPQGVQGLGDTVRNPAYATAAGLLLWGLQHGVVGEEPARGSSFELSAWWGRLGAWLRDLLPQ